MAKLLGWNKTQGSATRGYFLRAPDGLDPWWTITKHGMGYGAFYFTVEREGEHLGQAGTLYLAKQVAEDDAYNLLRNRGLKANPEPRAPRTRSTHIAQHQLRGPGYYVISTKTGNYLSGPWKSEGAARDGAYGNRANTQVVHVAGVKHNPYRVEVHGRRPGSAASVGFGSTEASRQEADRVLASELARYARLGRTVSKSEVFEVDDRGRRKNPSFPVGPRWSKLPGQSHPSWHAQSVLGGFGFGARLLIKKYGDKYHAYRDGQACGVADTLAGAKGLAAPTPGHSNPRQKMLRKPRKNPTKYLLTLQDRSGRAHALPWLTKRDGRVNSESIALRAAFYHDAQDPSRDWTAGTITDASGKVKASWPGKKANPSKNPRFKIGEEHFNAKWSDVRMQKELAFARDTNDVEMRNLILAELGRRVAAQYAQRGVKHNPIRGGGVNARGGWRHEKGSGVWLARYATGPSYQIVHWRDGMSSDPRPFYMLEAGRWSKAADSFKGGVNSGVYRTLSEAQHEAGNMRRRWALGRQK
jgi:hypothetical protein